jgi:hypothetical protein
MIGFLMLLFPLVLLGFTLIMERVEAPLNQLAVERDIEQFLDDANDEELDTFVREGTDTALSRFRQRLGLGRLRRRLSGRLARAPRRCVGLGAPPRLPARM